MWKFKEKYKIGKLSFFGYKKNRLCQRACGLGFRIAREPSLVFFLKKKILLWRPYLEKAIERKIKFSEKFFRFLRQRHRFHGGKAKPGPRYGNATDWAKVGRFAMRFRDFA